MKLCNEYDAFLQSCKYGKYISFANLLTLDKDLVSVFGAEQFAFDELQLNKFRAWALINTGLFTELAPLG